MRSAPCVGRIPAPKGVHAPLIPRPCTARLNLIDDVKSLRAGTDAGSPRCWFLSGAAAARSIPIIPRAAGVLGPCKSAAVRHSLLRCEGHDTRVGKRAGQSSCSRLRQEGQRSAHGSDAGGNPTNQGAPGRLVETRQPIQFPSGKARDACKPHARNVMRARVTTGYLCCSWVKGLKPRIGHSTRQRGPAHCRTEGPLDGGTAITAEGPQSRDGVRPLATSIHPYTRGTHKAAASAALAYQTPVGVVSPGGKVRRLSRSLKSPARLACRRLRVPFSRGGRRLSNVARHSFT